MMANRIIASQANLIATSAQATLPTFERQSGGYDVLEGMPDIPVTETEAQLAHHVVKMAQTISELEFEIAALRGELPPMAPQPSQHELETAAKAADEVEQEVLDFYGYDATLGGLMIGRITALEDRVLSGDTPAVSLMIAVCNARALEILRLNAILLGPDAPNLNDARPEAIFKRGISGPRYQVLLADVTPVGQKVSEGDILALSSVITRCSARSTEIMRSLQKLRKRAQEPSPSTHR